MRRLSFGLPPSEVVRGLDEAAIAIECVRRTLQHPHAAEAWVDQLGDGRWMELTRTVTEDGAQWRFVVKVHLTRAGELLVEDADVSRPGDEDEDDEAREHEEPRVPFGKTACPCCGHATLSSRGDYEICPVCFWEDDGQDDADAAVARGGPNRSSLAEARRSFSRIGASHEAHLAHVRRPTGEERQLRRFDEA